MNERLLIDEEMDTVGARQEHGGFGMWDYNDEYRREILEAQDAKTAEAVTAEFIQLLKDAADRACLDGMPSLARWVDDLIVGLEEDCQT